MSRGLIVFASLMLGMLGGFVFILALGFFAWQRGLGSTH